MKSGTSITLPGNGWKPRQDQMGLWKYFENGGLRGIEVAHRRWGKDEMGLYRTAIAACDVNHDRAQGRVGNYWHMLPLATQSRKAIWEAINPRTGIRRIDEAFPKEVIEDRRDGDMFVRFKTGSTWQVIGSDNFQGLLGAPPVGLVFSEWALADPHSWAFLSPILEENGGWAMFITTPRGRDNHAFRMYDTFSKNPKYWSERLSALQTPVFTKEQLEREKQGYIDIYGPDDGEALFNQEYMCSWDAPLVGSYYAKIMGMLENDGKLNLEFEHDPSYPVETAWDLGYSDDTAIWFFQYIRGELRLLDYCFANNQPPEYYAHELNDRYLMYNWKYYSDNNPRGAKHWVPWDARPKTLASGGKSLLEIFWNDHGVQLRVAPNVSVRDGIDNVRKLLKRAYFHKRCIKGVDCLRQYRREWDEDRKCFKDIPYHNWTSHGSDAFRVLANSYQIRSNTEPTDFRASESPRNPTFDELVEESRKYRPEDRI